MTPYICWIAVLSIAVGALRGLHQAQAMCKPTDKIHRQNVFTGMPDDIFIELYSAYKQFDLGTRGHRWYRWYHTIDAGSFATFAVVVWLLSHAGSWEPFGLALAVMWLAYEPVYQYGRYGTLMNTAYKEHVVFFDLIDFHASKWKMTAVRLALVAIMVWMVI